MEHLVLRIKRLDIGPPIFALQAAISPPAYSDIEKTILLLKEIGTITINYHGLVSSLDGDLTFMGYVVSNLPIDIRLGKFIVIAHAFGFIDEAIVIGNIKEILN